jgi:hypothetical protein
LSQESSCTGAISASRDTFHIETEATVRAGVSSLGPCWVRTASAPGGLDGKSAVTTGTAKTQVLNVCAYDLDRQRKVEAASNPTSSASLGVWPLVLQCDRSVNLEVAQQEGAFVESPASQPAGDFGVALTGVA